MRISRRCGSKVKGRIPTAKEEYDGVIGRTRGLGTVVGHGGHDGRSATEQAGGSVTGTGELATKMTEGSSPGSHVVS